MTGDSTRNRLSAIFFAFVMVTSMVAVGGVAFSGSVAGDAATVSSSSTHYLTAGVDAQDTKDSSGSQNTFSFDVDDGDMGNVNYIQIKASGVTWDTDNANFLTYGSTGGGTLAIDNVSYVDSKTLKIEASNTGDTGGPSTVNINGLALNVAPDASASGNDIRFQGSVVQNIDQFEVTKQAGLVDGTTDLAAGATGQSLSDITIIEPANTQNISDNNYDLSITVPEGDGITFSDGGSRASQSGSFDIDSDPASVSNTEIRYNVSSSSDSSTGNDAVTIQNIKVDVAKDATSTKFNVSLVPEGENERRVYTDAYVLVDGDQSTIESSTSEGSLSAGAGSTFTGLQTMSPGTETDTAGRNSALYYYDDNSNGQWDLNEDIIQEPNPDAQSDLKADVGPGGGDEDNDGGNNNDDTVIYTGSDGQQVADGDGVAQFSSSDNLVLNDGGSGDYTDSTDEDILQVGGTPVNVLKPQLQFNSGNDDTLAAGKNQEGISNPGSAFTVTSSADGDLAQGSTINISAPTGEGFEFSTQGFEIVDGNADLVVTEDGGASTQTVDVAADTTGSLSNGDVVSGPTLASNIQSALNNAGGSLSESYTVTYTSNNQFAITTDGSTAGQTEIRWSDGSTTLNNALKQSSDQTIDSVAVANSTTDNGRFIFQDSTNEVLNFVDDGGDPTSSPDTADIIADGDLSANTVVTGPQVAANLSDALNATASNGETYTVSYDSGTNKFTINDLGNDGSSSATSIDWDGSSITKAITPGSTGTQDVSDSSSLELDNAAQYIFISGQNNNLVVDEGDGSTTVDVLGSGSNLNSAEAATATTATTQIKDALEDQDNEVYNVDFDQTASNKITIGSDNSTSGSTIVQFSDSASKAAATLGFDAVDQDASALSSATTSTATTSVGVSGTGDLSGEVSVNDVSSDVLSVDVTADSSAGDTVTIEGVTFNTTLTANASAQSFTGTYANGITSTSNNGVSASTPHIEFNSGSGGGTGNGANATLFVDTDGVNNSNPTRNDNTDIYVLSQTAGDIGSGTFINVTLPADSSVTFDNNTAPTLNGNDAFSGNLNFKSDLSRPQKLVVETTAASDGGGNDYIEIDDVRYNATSSATGEVINPTVTTQPEPSVSQTNSTANNLQVVEATPDNVVYQASPDPTATQPAQFDVKIENSSLNAQNSANGNAFGGVNVNFEAASTPATNASLTVVNSTQTGADGVMSANLTFDTVGNYDVEAYPTGFRGVNATATVTAGAGSAQSLDLVTAKNGFVSDAGGSYTASDKEGRLVLTVKDSAGNNVTTGVSNIEAFLTVGGNAQIQSVEQNSFGGTAATTNGDGSYNVPSNGKLYVTYEDATAETVTADATERNDDVTAATGTDVSFYDPVTTVDVSTNVSSLSVGDAASVTYTISNSDGAVEVSGLSLSAGVNNGTVGSVAANSLTTDSSGQATTNFTAAENGTTTITGITKSKQGTTSITVEPTTVTPPSPIVGNNTPTDLDGDGTFEDANGDGDFNIVDVQAVFDNRDSSAVQNNPAAFDYNGDGEFTIVDVNRLFQDSQA